MYASRNIYCLGCDNLLAVDQVACPECRRCPNCGSKRAQDGPCECGHPQNADAIERLIKNRGENHNRSWFHIGLRMILVVVALLVMIPPCWLGCKNYILHRPENWMRERKEMRAWVETQRPLETQRQLAGNFSRPR